MSSRIPEPADPFEEEGLASQEPGLAGKRITGDPQDDMIVPTDRPLAVEDFGTTAAEQRSGEPLDIRIAREEPDLLADALSGEPDAGELADSPYPEDPDERAGRLVEPDAGGGPDREADATGWVAGTDTGGFSAEERALHIERED